MAREEGGVEGVVSRVWCRGEPLALLTLPAFAMNGRFVRNLRPFVVKRNRLGEQFGV